MLETRGGPTSRLAVVLVTLAAFTGCTTMQAIPDVSPTGIQQHVEPGDDVHVVLMEGRKFDLEVTRVEAESLTGVAPSGKTFRIRHDAIRWLEVAEADAGGFIGGIVGAIGAVYLAALTLLAIIIWEAD